MHSFLRGMAALSEDSVRPWAAAPLPQLDVQHWPDPHMDARSEKDEEHPLQA